MSKKQIEFDFQNSQPVPNTTDGLVEWRVQRERAMNRAGRQLGLPLGHRVEVQLVSGIQLRGVLTLKDELLFLDTNKIRQVELVVDSVPFSPREIESCVRLD